MSNDTDRRVEGKVVAIFHGFDGTREEVAVSRGPRIAVGANYAATVGKLEPRKDAVLELRFGDSVNFPVRAAYNDVELPKANVKAEIDGFKVTLTTDKPAFWVWMNAKGIRGEFDDNAVTLVPGEKRVFTFEPADKATTPEAFKTALTVVNLNDLTK